MLQKAVDDSATGHAKIQDGDLVIVYERHDKMKPVYVKNGENYQNRFGTFFHREWIGIPFGSKVLGKGGQGYIYLLAPTSELWTNSLPHRTQILYLADISAILIPFYVSFPPLALQHGNQLPGAAPWVRRARKWDWEWLSIALASTGCGPNRSRLHLRVPRWTRPKGSGRGEHLQGVVPPKMGPRWHRVGGGVPPARPRGHDHMHSEGHRRRGDRFLAILLSPPTLLLIRPGDVSGAPRLLQSFNQFVALVLALVTWPVPHMC
eukprot:1190583-Prorocentrum_minimum.AAC.2